jgi:hypothetical protein
MELTDSLALIITQVLAHLIIFGGNKDLRNPFKMLNLRLITRFL